jgi:methionyl-tRNA formyltransferase
MRIALIGQAAFGRAVLEALAKNDSDEIVGVFAPPKDDPIVEAAEALDLPVFRFGRMRDQEAIDQFKSLTPDLCVMAFVTDIVPMDMIDAPPKGTIQYHPSLLPLHRGPSSINWPIVMGETRTGLSIFWPDDGMDTGPLLLQRTIEIGPDDTLGSVYFGKLFPMGVEAIVESVELVREGNAPKIVQNEDDATYESWFGSAQAAIDWSKPGREIYNLIRGSDPQPGANSTLDGQKVRFYDAAFVGGGSEQVPGTVVAIGERVDIAVSGGTISVGRFRGTDAKVAAREYADSTGLTLGARFGD